MKELDNIVKNCIDSSPRLKSQTKKIIEPTEDDLPCFDCFLQLSKLKKDQHTYNHSHFKQIYLKQNGPCSCFEKPMLPFSFCQSHFKPISWSKAGPCLCFIHNEKEEKDENFRVADDTFLSIDLIPVFTINEVRTSELFARVSIS